MPRHKVIPEGNGNILFGFPIPDEILLNIFLFVNDKDSIRVIPRVCKHWYSLSKSWAFWGQRFPYLGIKISQKRLDQLKSSWKDDHMIKAVQWLFLNKNFNLFNQNLIHNPCGRDKKSHWKIGQGYLGTKVNIEEPPIGCLPIPVEADAPTQHCFVTSFSKGERKQVIELRKRFGLTVDVLRNLQPDIEASEWVVARHDCGSWSEFIVSFIHDSKETEVIIKDKWESDATERNMWFKRCVRKQLSFDDSFVGFSWETVGCDTQFWAGNYGAKSCQSSLIMDLSN